MAGDIGRGPNRALQPTAAAERGSLAPQRERSPDRLTERISRQQKHLDYLIADFAAIKAEIARRSTLQRVVLAGYFAVLALVFQQAVSLTLLAPWIVALWAASAFGFQFYAREGLEIARLGAVIRMRIAPVAGEIIGASLSACSLRRRIQRRPRRPRPTGRGARTTGASIGRPSSRLHC